MNKVVLKDELSTVATSGDYNDLSNKLPVGDINNLNADLKTLLANASQDINFLNALNQVFQCGNNVKSETVTALLAKGATGVTVNSSWTDIIIAINNLVVSAGGNTGVEGTLQHITKLNISAGGIKTIDFGRTIQNLELATSVLLFVPGTTGVVEHECSFDNTDASNFNYDANYIVFDGKMHPINSISKALSDLGAIGSMEAFECEIDESPYKSVDSIIDGDTSITIGVVPPDQLITAKSDMDLTGIDKLKSISETATDIRFALSFDGGATYYVWDGTEWVTVDITNTTDVKNKFMTNTVLSGLTNTQLEAIRNGSTKLRIAYLIEQTLSSDSCYTDQLDIAVDLQGKDGIAPQANWNYQLLSDNRTVQYTFSVAGTYTINYI